MSAETTQQPSRLPERLVDLVGPAARSPRTTLGILTLVATAAVTIASGTNVLSIVLAGLTVILLAGNPVLGPLGAAALVILTVPYDRAANGYLPRIATIPIRAQDVAVLLGIVLSLPSVSLRRPSRTVVAGLLAVFLAIGVVAVVAGLVGGNNARDIVRDSRWWFLYGSGVVLLFLPAAARAQLLRGLLLGAVAFAVVMVVTAIAPAVPGGLKARAQEFDFGLLRLQYGNSVFLLVPLAWATFAWLRGLSWAMAPLILAALAVMLSLTRTLMIVTVGVMLLAVVVGLLDRWRRGDGVRSGVGRTVAALAVLPITLAVALMIIAAAPIITPAPRPGSPNPSPGAPAPEDPFGRVTFDNDESNWASITGGRMKTYLRAIEIIAANPLRGSGMGATVVAEYGFGGEAFATPGRLPNVDNAYLTAGMKGGLPAMLALLALLAWPAFRALGFLRGRIRHVWWLPAWLGIAALTMTQSFATTGYGPFLLGLLIVIFGRGYASTSVRRATSQE